MILYCSEINCNVLFLQESGASYCQITALYSELLVLDTHGKLHQWKWTEVDPYTATDVSDHVVNIRAVMVDGDVILNTNLNIAELYIQLIELVL